VQYQGGIQDWIWKGQPTSGSALEAIVNPLGNQRLRHTIEFSAWLQTFRLEAETVAAVEPGPQSGEALLYQFRHGRAVLAVRGQGLRELQPQDVAWDQSVLSQRRDPDQYPELTFLGFGYNNIRLYREWAFGRRTVFRQPQRADLRNDRLEEDFSNLALFLSRLRGRPQAKAALIERLRDLYEGLTDFEVIVEGGTVQVFFTEGGFIIPATRLSDGSLRYLCLLAMLCDPSPPPLIGIEEPELGLHPDLLPKVADLLVDASQRCQLIVTTHSDILVDALSEQPGSVVVCEKHDGRTSMSRLDPLELAPWLEKYRLGQLWTSGQLGGTRW
jgi:predicted ATPase